MNIIAIMGPHGVFYKDEPIKETGVGAGGARLSDYLATKQR
ncbi:lysine decarboxylase, constitutive [Escherichia coli]|uniref:Lysine decarboxylase, constitutive n=1 Tax=Escherichia coli TaxID=562 RepID=A0A377DFN3_ECOLX|nr:lysine decarboxylase, constitutive [Escherichia coli]